MPLKALPALLALALFAAPALAQSPSAAGGQPAKAVTSVEATPFVTAADVDLLRLLPPPPPEDSDVARAELAEVLAAQTARTPAQAARAQADAAEDVWRFADAVGDRLKPEGLPLTKAFFERIAATEGAVVDPAKDGFKRRRPHQVSELVKPAVKLSNSGAWPSGHTTFGTLTGIVLADMIPEKRAAILARAWEYGDNRLVGGLHFRGDIAAGRQAGTAIAAVLMTRPDFLAAYAPARAELRAALGL